MMSVDVTGVQKQTFPTVRSKTGPEGWYLVDAALTQEHRVAVSSQKSRRYGSFYDIILSQI